MEITTNYRLWNENYDEYPASFAFCWNHRIAQHSMQFERDVYQFN